MTITQKINMDLKKHIPVPVVNAVQGDAYTRQVEISLLDGGAAWTVPSGVQVVAQYVRGDGTGGEYDSLPTGEGAAAVSGNVITLVLAPQMLTEAGTVQVTVALIREARQLSTFRLLVNVHPSAGAQVEGTEGYYHVNGFLPMPDAAEPGQYLRVGQVDSQGKTRTVEAVAAEDAAVWVPVPRKLDLTAASPNASRRTVALEGPLTLGEDKACRIRRLAVKAVPGAAVRFALFRFRADQGVMVKTATIGDAMADDGGLAVWEREEGFWITEENTAIVAMADSASIGCCLTGSGIRVSGQLRFEDGDHRLCQDGTQIPCTQVTEETALAGDVWYALYAIEADSLTRMTVGQYLLQMGLALAELDGRIGTVLPYVSVLDDGKVLTVADGKYVLEKLAASGGGLPPVTGADEGKLLQVVDGVYTPVGVADSAVAAYVNGYMEEALGGEY